MSDLTPWGESYESVAEAAMADPAAPGVLKLAAWLYLHTGSIGTLRSLIEEAVALSEDAPTLPA